MAHRFGLLFGNCGRQIGGVWIPQWWTTQAAEWRTVCGGSKLN